MSLCENFLKIIRKGNGYKDYSYYEEELKQMYDQLKENIVYAQKITRTSSWTYDIQKDEYFYTNEIYNILGCRFQEFDGKIETYRTFIHPDYIPQMGRKSTFMKEQRFYMKTIDQSK